MNGMKGFDVFRGMDGVHAICESVPLDLWGFGFRVSGIGTRLKDSGIDRMGGIGMTEIHFRGFARKHLLEPPHRVDP